MQTAKRYKGIDYVRLESLPLEEMDQIVNWLNSDTLIKIQTETELMRDCILYKDYEHWYNNVFSKISLVEEQQAGEKYPVAKKNWLGWSFNES